MDDDYNRRHDNVIRTQELQKFRPLNFLLGFYSTPLSVLFLAINYVLPIFGYKLAIVHPVTLIYAFLVCLVWHTEFKVML